MRNPGSQIVLQPDALDAASAASTRGPSLPTPPTPRRRFHQTGRFLLRPLFRALFGMEGEGLEHVPRHGPYLLASNHVSMLDWAFLSYYMAGIEALLDGVAERPW
jgi:1-acyl-sn-glycerol-3-phosphate acyltransferase